VRKSKAEIRAAEVRQLGTSMKRLVTGIRLLLEDALEEEGITLAQLKMLSALQENAELSAAELARTCFITPQSMQAVVTRAEQERWIVRTPAPENRRILTARLTPAGRQVLERGSALYELMANDLWGSTSVEQLKDLNRTLGAAVDRLQPGLQALHAKEKPGSRKTA
jgi:MarR family transcriptional regulator, organic hydroperoxide resistance regulator